MLQKHPLFFSCSQKESLLGLFLQLMGVAKESLVLQEIISCIKTLSPLLPHNGPYHIHSAKTEWTSIFELTLRLVSGGQCIENGLDLLVHLIETRKTEADTVLFSYFLRGIFPPCKNSYKLLRILLRTKPLPKHLHERRLQLDVKQEQDSRIELIHHLLSIEFESNIKQRSILSHAKDLSDVLLLLRLHDPGRYEPQSGIRALEAEGNTMINLEQIYLKSSLLDKVDADSLATPPASGQSSQSRSLVDVEREVVDRLMSFFDQIWNQDLTSSKESFELVTDALILTAYISHSITDTRLFEVFEKQALLDKFLNKLVAGNEPTKLTTVKCCLEKLLTFYEMFVSTQTDQNACNSTALAVLARMPDGLSKTLLSLVTSCETDQTILATPENRTNDFDPDFDDMPSTSFNIPDAVDDAFEDGTSTNDNHHVVPSKITFGSCTLSTRDECRLTAATIILRVDEIATICRQTKDEDKSSCIDTFGFFLDKSESEDMREIAGVMSFLLVCAQSIYEADNFEESLAMIANVSKKHADDARVATVVLKVFRDMLHQNGLNITPQHQTNLIHLIKAYANRISKDMYGHNVTYALYEVNLELVKIDPYRRWSSYAVEADERCGEIYSLLRNPLHEFRIAAGSSTKWILQDGHTCLPLSIQDERFQNIYQIAIESLDFNSGTDDGLQIDEKNGRVSSFLFALSSVAVTSQYLESKALVALFCSNKLFQLRISDIKLAIQRIASHKKLCLYDYIQQHLHYILSQWIHEKYQLEEFPFQLLDVPNFSGFCALNWEAICLALCHAEKPGMLTIVADQMGLAVSQLFCQGFANVMASIIPYIVYSTRDPPSLSRSKINSGIKLYKLMEAEMGKKSMVTLMGQHMGDVVFSLINLAHDSALWYDNEMLFPPSNFFFEIEIVKESIESMHSVCFSGEKGVITLLAEQRWSMHTVLHGLLVDLASSTSANHYRWSLAKVSLLVELLEPHWCTSLHAMDAYIVKRIIHMLTCYIEDIAKHKKQLAVKSHQILYRALHKIIHTNPDILAPYLSLLFSRLIKFVNEPLIWESAVPILGLLLESSSENITSTLADLPLLPDDWSAWGIGELRRKHLKITQRFQRSTSLQHQIEGFLDTPENEITINTLKHILKMLQNKKREISKLSHVKGSEGINLVHALIYQLISCVSILPGTEIQSLCLDCLGELGPIDLDTQLFFVESRPLKQMKSISNQAYAPYVDVIVCLNGMTSDMDTEVVHAANEALRTIFATKIGIDLVRKFDDSFNHELLPFLHESSKNAKKPQEGSIELFEKLVCQKEIWEKSQSYDQWIKSLTVALLKAGTGSNFFDALIDLCQISSPLCTKIVPYVFHLSLKIDTKNRRRILSNAVSSFINNELAKPPSSAHAPNNNDQTIFSKMRISIILKIINYLRLQTPPSIFTRRKNLTRWENNFWLDLDYSVVAHAASLCGAPFSAILYAEVSCEQIQDQLPVEEDKKSRLQARQAAPLLRIRSAPNSARISNLLLQTYDILGDSHGIEACSGTLVNSECLVQGLQGRYRKHWMPSLAISDAATDSTTIIDNLSRTGLYHTLNTYLSSSYDQSTEALEAKAECCWRLTKWGDNVQLETSDLRCDNQTFGFHQSFVGMLTELKKRDTTGIQDAIERSKMATIKLLHDNSKESTSSIYPVLSQLQITSEFRCLSGCLSLPQEELNIARFDVVSRNLDLHGTNQNIDYDHLEPILSARAATLNVMLSVTQDHCIQERLFETLMKKCELARMAPAAAKTRQYQAAILECRTLNLKTEQLWRTELEEAHFGKTIKNHRNANNILDKLLTDIQTQNLPGNSHLLVYSKALSLAGEIYMESRTKSPTDIVTDYLLKAINIQEEHFPTENRASSQDIQDSFYQLGKYGDMLYQEVYSYITSEHWKRREKQIENSKKELAKVIPLLASTKKTAPEYLSLARSEKLLNKDITRESNILNERQQEAALYLRLGLENYLKCLSACDDTKLLIFRVIAMWLENLKVEEVNLLMNLYTQKIKSHQFLPLLYQLVARLTKQTNSQSHHSLFPRILVKLLERICQEHPHHSLPIVLMLANSHLDEQFCGQVSLSKTGSQSRQKAKMTDTGPVAEEDRVQSAKLLINQLKRSNIAEHLCELEKVCVAYVQLANAQIGNTQQTESVPMGNQPLTKLGNMKHTVPLSRPICVQPSMCYTVPPIFKWDPKFNYVGGINSPKRLSITSSDGVQTSELLKGNDDMRQDAVLEQVFTVINDLLRKDPEARKQRLSIRTYVVTPFSQKSGIIQWCDNTVPIGAYLIEAHQKHFPQHWKTSACRKKLALAKNETPEVLLKTYEEILDNFPPVFRFFFYEEFIRPQSWFSHRQAYTRSIATSSIAGYILGIGDRHVQNLLLDTQSAEIIHIDLGIAFENGKLLPTPELIPFRLTQDIIDGLGVSGVEGPLRLCMETTLKVLRQSKTVLTTIVEVLKYDPLHQWTLSPKQIAKIQKIEQEDRFYTEGSSAVSMAERALIRVQQKLNGLQEGLVLSVPEHVSVLIQQATDHNNLSQVFNGWQPYL